MSDRRDFFRKAAFLTAGLAATAQQVEMLRPSTPLPCFLKSRMSAAGQALSVNPYFLDADFTLGDVTTPWRS